MLLVFMKNTMLFALRFEMKIVQQKYKLKSNIHKTDAQAPGVLTPVNPLKIRLVLDTKSKY